MVPCNRLSPPDELRSRLTSVGPLPGRLFRMGLTGPDWTPLRPIAVSSCTGPTSNGSNCDLAAVRSSGAQSDPWCSSPGRWGLTAPCGKLRELPAAFRRAAPDAHPRCRTPGSGVTSRPPRTRSNRTTRMGRLVTPTSPICATLFASTQSNRAFPKQREIELPSLSCATAVRLEQLR